MCDVHSERDQSDINAMSEINTETMQLPPSVSRCCPLYTVTPCTGTLVKSAAVCHLRSLLSAGVPSERIGHSIPQC